PSTYGSAVTFTAIVSPNAGGAVPTPTGTASFLDGTTVIGTGTLSGGTATFTTSTLATGLHSISVSYSGDNNFTTSISAVLSQTLSPDGTSAVVSSSAHPSTYGESVSFTATVSASAPGSGTPTGTVTFLDGTTVIGTGTLSSGIGTFSTS